MMCVGGLAWYDSSFVKNRSRVRILVNAFATVAQPVLERSWMTKAVIPRMRSDAGKETGFKPVSGKAKQDLSFAAPSLETKDLGSNPSSGFAGNLLPASNMFSHQSLAMTLNWPNIFGSVAQIGRSGYTAKTCRTIPEKMGRVGLSRQVNPLRCKYRNNAGSSPATSNFLMENLTDLLKSEISGGFTEFSGMSLCRLENPSCMGMIKQEGCNQNHVLNDLAGVSA